MRRISIISVIFIAFFFTQCNKEETNNEEEQLSVSADIDGDKFIPTESNSQQNELGGITIVLQDEEKIITLSTNHSEVGTYNIGSLKASNSGTASISKDGVLYNATSGSIIITSNSDNKVSGSFNFVANNITVNDGGFEDIAVSDITSLITGNYKGTKKAWIVEGNDTIYGDASSTLIINKIGTAKVNIEITSDNDEFDKIDVLNQFLKYEILQYEELDSITSEITAYTKEYIYLGDITYYTDSLGNSSPRWHANTTIRVDEDPIKLENWNGSWTKQ